MAKNVSGSYRTLNRLSSSSESSREQVADLEKKGQLMAITDTNDVESAARSTTILASSTKSGSSSILWTLLAPFICLVLGVLIDTHFLPLIVVFLFHSVKPVLYSRLISKKGRRTIPSCMMRLMPLRQEKSGADDNNDQQAAALDDMVAYTLQMHRSMAVQLIVLIGFLVVYHATEKRCGGNDHQAYQNAYSIIFAEHALGIDIEPTVQQWLLPHEFVLGFFDQYYAIMHFTVTAWTVGWLLVAGKDARYRHRASFGLTLVLALLGYWYIPTMPPRLLSRYHYTYALQDDNNNITNTIGASISNNDDAIDMKPWYDLVDTLREKESTYDKLMQSHGNPYAAMPSMHTGWALWSALVVWDEMVSRPCVMALMFGHVLTMMFATIVSANHYVLDLFAGITCVLAGRAMARILTGQAVRANVSYYASRWYAYCCGGNTKTRNGSRAYRQLDNNHPMIELRTSPTAIESVP